MARAGEDVLRLERQVCFTLAVAAREVVSLYRPLLEPLGLTHPQYLIMVALWEADGPLTVKELVLALTLEAPTLSPVLKRLESAGLVERQRDPRDERLVRVSLTERGDALRERASEVPMAIVTQLGMTVPEVRALRDSLSEVIARAKAYETGRGRTPQPGTPSQPRR